MKNPPAVLKTQEKRLQYLGLKDILEKEMTNHSSIFAGKISCTEEPGRPRVFTGLQKMTQLND